MAENPSHLSRISTMWTVVRQAHRSESEAHRAARHVLLARYAPAIRRYALGVLQNPEAAEDLLQDFSVRFLSGKLGGADPQRGRFRDFIKGTLFHMVADYHRRQIRQPRQLPEHGIEPGEFLPTDEPFIRVWRNQLLDRCWTRLQELEQSTGRPYFTVLKNRAERPAATSQRIARHCQAAFHRPFTAAGIRQLIHRARRKFADFLIDEVLQTLAEPNADELELELADLELLPYCRDALAAWKDEQR